MPTLAAGAVFAGHRIEEVIGRGGMGIVYRATHLRLNRPVAVKVLTPELSENEDFRARFERESLVAAQIDHPHVIPLHEAGDEDGMLFLTMRYVRGSDLGAMIQAETRLAPAVVASIVSQVASALDAAHGHGLVHRDVKPANVLVTPLAGGYHAYLTDFGISKRLRSQSTGASGQTATGVIVGSLDYLAPEQIEGKKLGPAADIYALGCLAHHALTGRVPYPQRSAPAKMFAHVQEDPPSARDLVPELSPTLDDVVRRAMAKQPGARYPTAGEFGAALVAAVDPSAAGGSEPERGSASVARNRGEAAPRADARPVPESPAPPAPVRAEPPAPQRVEPAAPQRVEPPAPQPQPVAQAPAFAPNFGSGDPPLASPIPPELSRGAPPKASARPERRFPTALAAGAALLALGAVAAVLLLPGSEETRPPTSQPQPVARPDGPAEAAVRVTVNDFSRAVATGAFGNACQHTSAGGFTVDGRKVALAACTRALPALRSHFADSTIQTIAVSGGTASATLAGNETSLSVSLKKAGRDWFLASIDRR